MAKTSPMTKYFSSWLLYVVISIISGFLLALIFPNNILLYLIQFLISIMIIYLISVYREMSFLKTLVFIWLLNIIIIILFIVLILVVVS